MIHWRNSGTKWRIWKWVYGYAKEKLQQNWPFQDRLCPNCKTWASEGIGFTARRDSMGLSPHETMQCERCGYTSRWHNEGIIAWSISADAACRCEGGKE